MTKNYIAGEWLSATEASANVNPSNTNDVVGEYARASVAEAERAIAAAYDAFPAGSRSTIQQRSRLGSRCRMKPATISATSASNVSSQPYSCA